MTLDEEIEFWDQKASDAKTRDLALVCFGIKAGLNFAKRDHFPKYNKAPANDQANQKRVVTTETEMPRRLTNVSPDAPKQFRDEPRQTVYRHWVCGADGCDGEMKCLGHGISNAMGSNWAHQCEKCKRDEWASCSYPSIAHIPFSDQ